MKKRGRSPINTHNKKSLFCTSQVCQIRLADGRSQQVKEYKHTHTHTHTTHTHTHIHTHTRTERVREREREREQSINKAFMTEVPVV